MIEKLLHTLTIRLEEYLAGLYQAPEGLVQLGRIAARSGSQPVNKMTIALARVERETAMGITSGRQSVSPGAFSGRNPPWHLNICIVIAAVFCEERYPESLRMLSDTMAFLQQNFSFRGADGVTYTLEPLTLTLQEESNLWSMLGSAYYPSVACRIRRLSIDSGEITGTTPRIRSTE